MFQILLKSAVCIWALFVSVVSELEKVLCEFSLVRCDPTYVTSNSYATQTL
jgi:hypothetical protein